MAEQLQLDFAVACQQQDLHDAYRAAFQCYSQLFALDGSNCSMLLKVR
jgi:hypothetical protein